MITHDLPSNNERTQLESDRAKERKALDENITTAAEYLDRLDRYAEDVEVDTTTGSITYTKPRLTELTNPAVQEYQQRFTTLLQQFKERNELMVAKFKKTEHVVDVSEIAGAIVVTYNSAIATPDISDEDIIFDDAASRDRGKHYKTSSRFLGVVIIDINPSKRIDGTSPTTSTIHELHHHMLTISDYLISINPAIGMQSAYRFGRSGALYGENPDRLTTYQAQVQDSEQYSALLDRDFYPATDIPRIEAQTAYLNELHSSYLQRKANWFDATQGIYTVYSKGKHWEVVGDHPKDIQASKNLLAYLQGFYTLDIICKEWSLTSQSRAALGEGQLRFTQEFPNIYRKTGALVGAARTLTQAERLVSEAWKACITTYPKLPLSPRFKTIVSQWELGAGSENISSLLLP